VAFSPLSLPNPTIASAPLRPDELLGVVRTAAGQLVADLDRAEELTGRWSNQALADALVDAALSRCLGQLASTGCWGEPNRIPSSELWRIAGGRLEPGWLQHRARFKPLGYAGDHEMLDRICNQTCCDDPLGRVFDRYFLRQAAPQAVLARTEQTAATLVADCLARACNGYHVTSVGAGPGSDLGRALAVLPEDRRHSVRVTLLDLDPDALEHARRRLEPLLAPGGLACERVNLNRLSSTAKGQAALGAPDVLICSGLFDYLEDDAAAAMLRCFWQRLAPGGLLLVGNFAPHNPTRAYMEWIGNWYLTYRTPHEMENLAGQAGIPNERFSIRSERLGVDLFLVGRKV
jgi:extracellular factor (EF) 3-hydroxypalmitic acid methyl ester biosynthesis protein